MSLSESFAGPIIESVNGKDVTFNRLLIEDYGTLESLVRQERKRFLRGLLDECKIASSDRFVALRDGDSPWVSDRQVLAYTSTYDGAKKAVTISLKSAGCTDEQATEIVRAYSHPDLANLAWTLLGFAQRLRPGEPSDKGDAKAAIEDPTETPKSE